MRATIAILVFVLTSLSGIGGGSDAHAQTICYLGKIGHPSGCIVIDDSTPPYVSRLGRWVAF